MMDEHIEPKFYVTDFEDWEDGTGPHSTITLDEEKELTDPETQVWDWTDMMEWCVENLNGKFKVLMSGYNDFYIELYDEDDAAATKLRWM